MELVNRRQFLKTGLVTATAISAAACTPRFLLEKISGETYHYRLTAEAADLTIRPGISTSGLGFNGQYPAPILKAKQGEVLRIEFVNKLDMATTIHWHGIRIVNAMDGVPFLTQAPIQPGETFIYEFTPPDAGTFWYHPHMHSVEQLGKGLVGLLIVEEREKPDFDFDESFALKNWHLNEDGTFKPLSIPRYAARMGTPGNYETVNGLHKPVVDVPAGGWLRLRFANIDNTLVYKLAVKDHPAYVVAIDANPLPEPLLLKDYSIGAGMRVDIIIKAPKNVGEDIIVQNGKGKLFFTLLALKTVASTVRNRDKAPRLPLNPLPEPDLKNAETKGFVFEWEGAVTPISKQGKAQHKFWTINRRSWSGMSEQQQPEPLAVLQLGKTYIFDLKNNTPHMHPIHLHGVMFKVLKSSKKKIHPHFADTVLLAKNERVKIAFVADNPGNWMYHCHVIEHMKTGLMGYISVA